MPWYLRVELRHRIPILALLKLDGAEYHVVLAGTAGSTFAMTQPFAFGIDPAELLDD